MILCGVATWSRSLCRPVNMTQVMFALVQARRSRTAREIGQGWATGSCGRGSREPDGSGIGPGAERLLQAQCGRAIGVVAGLLAEPAITRPLVEIGRALVVVAHFEPQRGAAVPAGVCLDRSEQLAAEPAELGRHGQRVEASAPAAGPVEEHGITGDGFG